MRNLFINPTTKLFVILFLCFSGTTMAQRDPQSGKTLADKYANTKLITLATSPGGKALELVQIGKVTEGKPAIFVAANMGGNNPTATIGATWLAESIAKDENLTKLANWYILPCGNPDALLIRHQKSPKWDSPTNMTPFNDDNDENIDEDGPDDLNGDGLITQMLVKHPLGEYVKDTADSRLVRKAKLSEGEKGIYKLFTEGFDNDGDGKYNEDPLGGVNMDRNFTYMYEPFKPNHGKWNGSEVESNALMKFYAEHPEIAMTIVIGENNTLLFPPEKDKKGSSSKIKVPGYYASRLGIDEKKTYTADELKETIVNNVDDQAMGMRILKSLINSTPPTKYEADDIDFHSQITKEFKQHLKEKKINIDVEKPTPWANGSFEKFAYFQYGTPTFSVNLWQLPKNEKKKTQTEKILAFTDSLELNVFVPWEKVEHPDFEDVEVGGLKPFTMITPPADSLDKLLEGQLSFIQDLPKTLPSFKLEVVKKDKSKDLVQIDVFVTNQGQLPYPTAMGYRNGKPFPVVLKVSGNIELLSGKVRTPIKRLNSGETTKITYLMNKQKANQVELKLESKNIIVKNPSIKIEL